MCIRVGVNTEQLGCDWFYRDLVTDISLIPILMSIKNILGWEVMREALLQSLTNATPAFLKEIWGSLDEEEKTETLHRMVSQGRASFLTQLETVLGLWKGEIPDLCLGWFPDENLVAVLAKAGMCYRIVQEAMEAAWKSDNESGFWWWQDEEDPTEDDYLFEVRKVKKYFPISTAEDVPNEWEQIEEALMA
jgi:hypothetical protein